MIDGGVAAKAGIKANDMVVSINGKPIDSFQEMQRTVSTSPGLPLALVIERGGQRHRDDADTRAEGHHHSVRQAAHRHARDPGLTQSGRCEDWSNSGPSRRFRAPSTRSGSSSSGRARMSAACLRARKALISFGPIRIAQVSGQVATAGFVALLNFGAHPFGFDRPD